jgi:hypothetical protein
MGNVPLCRHLRHERTGRRLVGLVAEIVADRPRLQAQPVGDIGIGRGAGAAGTMNKPEVGLSALLKQGQR